MSAEAHDAAGDDWDTAVEESELLAIDGADYDRETFLACESSPVLFTAAAFNFGVSQLLDVLVEFAPAPRGALGVDGNHRAVDARSARSCSRCRPGWILRIGIGSPMRVCSRVRSSAVTSLPTPRPASRSSPSTRSRCSVSNAPPWHRVAR